MILTGKKIAARATLAAAVTALLYWLDSDPWTDGLFTIVFNFFVVFAIVMVMSAIVERKVPRK